MPEPKPAPDQNPPAQTPPVTPPGTPQPRPPATPPDQPGTPQPGKPIGDPPSKDKPMVTRAIAAASQVTLEPGENGGRHGSVHTAPLVKNAPQQTRVGPGTYGNDQFNAEHHDDAVQDRTLPEGLCDPQGGPLRPTAKAKEDRYGRVGSEGNG
jgi:hypothetical protein